jgi:hypothetical protein
MAKSKVTEESHAKVLQAMRKFQREIQACPHGKGTTPNPSSCTCGISGLAAFAAVAGRASTTVALAAGAKENARK